MAEFAHSAHSPYDFSYSIVDGIKRCKEQNKYERKCKECCRLTLTGTFGCVCVCVF